MAAYRSRKFWDVYLILFLATGDAVCAGPSNSPEYFQREEEEDVPAPTYSPLTQDGSGLSGEEVIPQTSEHIEVGDMPKSGEIVNSPFNTDEASSPPPSSPGSNGEDGELKVPTSPCAASIPTTPTSPETMVDPFVEIFKTPTSYVARK
ncbi:uncharacterized protein [Prorops nasuta]|uniref:uncharacterized protein n=1 Tax=Prorops nasuta TaxID=863751 RepID=UPI0034D01D22